MSRRWRAKDNTDNGVKIAIRQRLLSMLGAEPCVLDCFAGEGKIYLSCYKGLEYLGLDTKAIDDGRNLLRADNRKYLRSADLSRFNFFDLDAYGSPWHQFLIIMKRRKVAGDEKIAVTLTDGLKFNMAMSDLPAGLKPYVGIPRKMKIPALCRHEDFIRRLVVVSACNEAGLSISESLIGQNPRGNMKYIGLLLMKNID